LGVGGGGGGERVFVLWVVGGGVWGGGGGLPCVHRAVTSVGIRGRAPCWHHLVF